MQNFINQTYTNNKLFNINVHKATDVYNQQNDYRHNKDVSRSSSIASTRY